MFTKLPRNLKRAAICEVAAILFLLASLFCHRAIPYLLTIGLGSICMVLGLFFTFVTLARALRADAGEQH
jgi:1,4-dihydroxy-2-naphthoate octaprenyltransferase